MSDVIPSKSDAYRFAESAFFTQFNQIDIYVEDEDQEELYFCILSRVLNGIRFEKIFPLGGKPAVLEHAKTARSAGSLYLLDKDFDDLLNKIEKISQVIYLNEYCIENYLIEFEAIIKLIVAQNPKLKSPILRQQFDLDEFRQKHLSELRLLFALFYLAQKHDLGIKNTSLSADQFLKTSGAIGVDVKAVEQYKGKIASLLAQRGIDLNPELVSISAAFELDSQGPYEGRNICGKYLIRILILHLSNAFQVGKVSLEVATYRLAENCEFRSLAYLQQRAKDEVAQRVA